jgi:4-amino-4-deoxy-L-arabinose transferase-like glycosyltransferase
MNRLARLSNASTFQVWLLIVVCLSATAWLRPLQLPDEGRYVGVAWEMVRSGDWLVPTMNNLPFFHKPPLFYWITAAFISLFGQSELAARAAPILGASVGALATYLLIKRWVDARTAVIALITLLAYPLWFLGGQYANLDMLVAGCITLTITLLAHSALLIENERKAQPWLIAAYASAAFGLLAKGLIGFVLPGAVIVAWLILRWQWRTLLRLISIPGIVVFAGIAAPWFYLMHQKFTDFLHYFFVVQHFKRFSGVGFNNPKPVYFYLGIVLICGLPWLVWGRQLWRGTRDENKRPTGKSLTQLMWVWLAVILLFFSIPNSKLIGYILPVAPAFAFLLGSRFVVFQDQTNAPYIKWSVSAIISLALSLVTVTWFTVNTDKSTKPLAHSLAAQRQAGEPIFMMGQYFFDFGYYAKLRDQVSVVDQWSVLMKEPRDDWRKELYDAKEFFAKDGRQPLLESKEFYSALCASPKSWVIAQPDAINQYPILETAKLIGTHYDQRLLLLERDNPKTNNLLKCEKMPSGDLEKK